MSKLGLLVPIYKVDEERRLVYGVATEEVLDKSHEIMDYETSKPYFEKWSQNAEKATGGQSLGNLRVMHQPIAAGKLTTISFDNDSKRIDIVAKVVDENEWQKVLEGVYTGFSMGGSYVKRWDDPDVPGAKRFTANPCEISLVDNPCVPTAHFQVVKADGITEERMFKLYEPTSDEVSARATEMAKAAGTGTWVDQIENAVAALKAEHAAPPADDGEKKEEEADGEAASDDNKDDKTKDDLKADDKKEEADAEAEPEAKKATRADVEKTLRQVWQTADGRTHARKLDAIDHGMGTPPASPVGAALAAAKAAIGGETPVVTVGLVEAGAALVDFAKVAEAHLMTKSLWHVGRLAELIESVSCIQSSLTYEKAAEGDDSTVPDDLAANISQLGKTFLAMAKEEMAELLAEVASRGAHADVATFALADDTRGLIKSIGEDPELAKIGARNSTKDRDLLQKAHDSIVAAGAACVTEETGDMAKMVAGDELKKLADENTMLKGQITEALDGIRDLEKTFTDRIEALRKEPTQMAPRTSVLEKTGGEGGSSTGDGQSAVLIEELKKTSEGRSMLADAAIRASQQGGMRL